MVQYVVEYPSIIVLSVVSVRSALKTLYNPLVFDNIFLQRIDLSRGVQ